jgi:hypothetical protein
MKPWKLVLGAGAACAACCAAPIVSGMAALGIGSGMFAGILGMLAPATGTWLLFAAAAAAAAGVAVVVWRSRARPEPAQPCCASCG